MADKSVFFKNILETYDRFMLLQVFVDSDDEKLIQKYKSSSDSHNTKVLDSLNNIDSLKNHIDAGFDLYVPCDIDSGIDCKEVSNNQYKVNHRIVCSAMMFTSSGKRFNTGYYLYPRSSISKTDIRLANSVGIIDSGYRGHLIGVFDYNAKPNNDSDVCVSRRIVSAYDRVLQVCAPGLVPILVEMVENAGSLGITERGNKGFGSSGS
jgi:dUTP pyrophosphatase